MLRRIIGLPLTVALFSGLVACGQGAAAACSPSTSSSASASGGVATPFEGSREDRPTTWDIVRTDPRMASASALLDEPTYPLLTILAEDPDATRFHTLFAPSEAAFDEMPDAVAQRLAGEGRDEAFIHELITMHWAEDADLDLGGMASGSIIPAAKTRLTYTEVDGVGCVDYAVVLDSVLARNGRVYLIDTVLIPPCIEDFGQQEPPPTHAPCETWLEPPT